MRTLYISKNKTVNELINTRYLSLVQKLSRGGVVSAQIRNTRFKRGAEPKHRIGHAGKGIASLHATSQLPGTARVEMQSTVFPEQTGGKLRTSQWWYVTAINRTLAT